MKQLFLLLIFYSCFPIDNKNSNISTSSIDVNVKEIEQTGMVSKILFSRKHSNDQGWSIYMMDPDGSNEKIIIPFKSGMGEYNPDPSSDGKTILFNTYRYGGWKLALYDIERKSAKRITMSSNYYTNGVFSPDGKRIVYEKNLQRSTHIFIADRDGKNEQMLTSKMGTQNRIPVWTPDGKSILFYNENANANDIYMVDIESGNIKNLTNNNSGNDFGPSVSPDGSKIAFFSDRNGFLDLFLMDITGVNQICLTSSLQSENNEYDYYTDRNMYWIFKTSWSPDSQSLVFSNSTGDNIDLFTVKKDGANLKQITNSSKSEYTPVWGLIEQ